MYTYDAYMRYYRLIVCMHILYISYTYIYIKHYMKIDNSQYRINVSMYIIRNYIMYNIHDVYNIYIYIYIYK